MSLQSETNEAAQALFRMLSSTPEQEMGPDPVKTPAWPRHVLAKHGWGDRYINPIELRGDQWLEAFEIAKPVVSLGGILALVGGRGPGKTQMAAELARGGDWPEDSRQFTGGDVVLSHRRQTALYRRAMDIFLDLRHAKKAHVKSSEKEELAKLEAVGLLVIDEFQEKGELEWERWAMKNLIDKRYSSSRPTIIIANYTRKELFDEIGESIVNRAQENGKSIEFSWESFRGKTKP